MKPMDMAEALFGSDDDATGKPEGSVDTSAMAAIAAHLAREDASPAPATAPAAASAGRDENETRAGGVTLLGNQHTQYPTDYDPSVLETFENKHPEHDYMVTFRCPEFTTLCPITGQPDFATLYINYVPDKRMVESKSLKLYLFSFRNHGDFHEDVVNVIMRDLVELMDPKYIEVRGMFYPRGGISIYPFSNWARPGAGYEQIAAERMFAQLSDLDSGDGARG